MKYLHIKLCGQAFLHSDKVIKIKQKHPIPHWDGPLKAFHKRKMKVRETDSYVISESSAESKARCRVLHITEKHKGVRVSLIWPSLPRLSFILSKSVWVQPSNMGNPSTNLFEPEDQRLEPCSPKPQMSFFPEALVDSGLALMSTPALTTFPFLSSSPCVPAFYLPCPPGTGA